MSDTPQTDTWTLTSGVVAKVAMPDLFGILSTFGSVPSPQIAAVLDLLVADGVDLVAPNPGLIYARKRDQLRGMYALAALILVEPRLVLSGEAGPGEIGPADLGFNDVEALYWTYFRAGRRRAAAPDPDADAAGGAQEPAPAGGGLPQGGE